MKPSRTLLPSSLFLPLSLPLFVLAGACSEPSPTPTPAPAATATALTANQGGSGEARKIPITSSSEEAIEIYREARRLGDRLRLEEAHELFAKAVELDPEFALAHLGLADTSKTVEGYYAALERAAKAAEKASQAERWWIHGQLFGANGNSGAELEYYSKLAEAYPDDERAHDLLGIYFYNVQDFAQAATHSRRACELAPDFSSPWNNLGYSLLSLGDHQAAEEAFVRNLELIPDEPNPYDSHGELLLKTGRYEEAIASYREALQRDPAFFSSLIGIGHAQVFRGDFAAARASFEQVLEESEELGYRRQARLGLASVALVAGDESAALGELEAHHGLSLEAGDQAAAAGDLRLIGAFHLARGRAAEAETAYGRALEMSEGSGVSDFVKEAARTRHLVYAAQVAIVRGDLATARRLGAEHRAKIDLLKEPADVRRAHQLAAEIALAEGDWSVALDELAQADRFEVRVNYLQALAARGAGDPASARRFATRIVERNEPYYGYAVYWQAATELLDALGG